MPRSRRKSINQIARQAGGMSGRIWAERTRLARAGQYGSARDIQLRNRELRALRTANRYYDNILNRLGLAREINGTIPNINGINDRPISRRTYMGLANG